MSGALESAGGLEGMMDGMSGSEAMLGMMAEINSLLRVDRVKLLIVLAETRGCSPTNCPKSTRPGTAL
eukprot:1041455-Rhodomonas_salina.2